MIGGDADFVTNYTLDLNPEEKRELRLFIKVPEEMAQKPNSKFNLIVQDDASHYQIKEKMNFITDPRGGE